MAEQFKVSKSILTRPPADPVLRRELISVLKELTTFARQTDIALNTLEKNKTTTTTTTSGNGYFPQGWG